jgi:thioredoxin 1
MGTYSQRLENQRQEIIMIKAKTDRLMERRQAEGVGGSEQELLEEIKKMAQSSPAFAACFGAVQVQEQPKIDKATTLLASKLKKLTSAWYGQFADTTQDQEAASLVATIHEHAKKLLSAPKTVEGDMINLVLYCSISKRCRLMKRNVDFVVDELGGLITLEFHEIKDDEQTMHQLGLENLPTLIFKRGKTEIATHQGELSISALQSKVNILLEGANFSDSSSVKSVEDMKSVNEKELYNISEYLLFYFTASWCGICKRTTSEIEQYTRDYSKVKFEQIEVDGSHRIHKSFGVTEVPALVFVHDGKVAGKHTGYINSSTFTKLLEDFAVANVRQLGTTHSGDATPIKEDSHSLGGHQIQNKTPEQ